MLRDLPRRLPAADDRLGYGRHPDPEPAARLYGVWRLRHELPGGGGARRRGCRLLRRAGKRNAVREKRRLRLRLRAERGLRAGRNVI